MTVCAAESSLLQVIFWPTFALIVCGANANPLIATDSPPVAGFAGAVVAAGVDAAASGLDSSPPSTTARGKHERRPDHGGTAIRLAS